MPAVATNLFEGSQDNQVNGPMKHGLAITKSDTDELATVCRQIQATGAGNIAIVTVSGETVVFPIGAGERVNVMAKQILSTSTTATGIIVWW